MQKFASIAADDRLHAPASTVHEGSRFPIFAVPGMHGYLEGHAGFAAGLHPQQRFHIFQLPGLRESGARLRRVGEIASAFGSQIRQQHPDGPVNVAAFCMGSLIALELVHRLRAEGRPVAGLVLIEPNMPSCLARLHEAGAWHDPGAVAELESEARRLKLENFYRKRLLALRGSGADPMERRYPHLQLSLDARAKLLAAYRVYRPSLLDMHVDVVVSRQRARALARPSCWDSCIPARTVHVAADTHAQVLSPHQGATAALAQRLLD